jgi:hypothetical protein
MFEDLICFQFPKDLKMGFLILLACKLNILKLNIRDKVDAQKSCNHLIKWSFLPTM